MLDLYNKQYDIQTLKKNIYLVNLLDILKTQKLDVIFIVKYILNNKFQFTKDEQLIDMNDVLFYQPHISKEILKTEYLNYKEDYDSIDDFSSYN
jgi:hypothetical protein